MRHRYDQLLIALALGFIISYGVGCSTPAEEVAPVEKAAPVKIFNKAKMDSLFMAIDSNDVGFGSVSIFKDGKEIYANAIGYAHIGNDLKNNINTKFKIGAITNTFTASIIIKLIEEKKLTFDTPLDEFFPNVANAKTITIDQMLRHRTGILDFASDPNFSDFSSNDISSEDLALKIEESESIFEPDEKFKYSNSNYALLGFIAEKIENKPLGEIMQERIFDPLKMKNTYYGIVPTTDNVAVSYKGDTEWEEADKINLTVLAGTGAITATANDLNIFYNALFLGQFVTEESLKKMKSLKDNFGLGLFRAFFNNKVGIGHFGGVVDGFQSGAMFFSNDNTSIVYLSNGVDLPINQILNGIVNICSDKEYKIPSFEPVIAYDIDPKLLPQYEGVYSNDKFPMNITITQLNNDLYGRATGQGAFKLNPVKEHHFEFAAAGVKIDFIPEENIFHFQQGATELDFTKLTYDEKDLNQYVGLYELADSEETALVAVDGNRLKIAATWEGTSDDYSVWAYEKDKFSGLDVELVFITEDGEQRIDWSQGPDIYKYKKKK